MRVMILLDMCNIIKFDTTCNKKTKPKRSFTFISSAIYAVFLTCKGIDESSNSVQPYFFCGMLNALHADAETIFFKLAKAVLRPLNP